MICKLIYLWFSRVKINKLQKIKYKIQNPKSRINNIKLNNSFEMAKTHVRRRAIRKIKHFYASALD